MPRTRSIENQELFKQGKRICHSCHKIKDLSEFYRTTRRGADGHKYSCKECEDNYNKNRKNTNSTYKSEKLKTTLKRYYVRTYGITMEQKEQMFKDQEAKCLICKDDIFLVKGCHVDHDHETKQVRGLLCSKCNHGLGLFRENTNILQEAINYLKKWKK